MSGVLFAQDYWQQDVHYFMDVTLDTSSNSLEGTSVIKYTNNSPDSLDRIYLHLYPLAFKKGSLKYSEFEQGLGSQSRGKLFLENPALYSWDFIIHHFSISSNSAILSNQYVIDETLLVSYLSTKIAPGESIEISIGWTEKIGQMFERAGYLDDLYNMAQWYPKLVVYDEHGWANIPFHAEGEFYGEFGTYDVTFTLPDNYIIGATGVVTEGDPGWSMVQVDTGMAFEDWEKSIQEQKKSSIDSLRTVRFHAEQVHDFAWCASPDFYYENGSWNGIDVHVLYLDSNADKWKSIVLERSEKALEWLSEQFGMYPYPQMTVVDRKRSGGMEYPMIVMNGRESEGLIVHEIGHNWFYGILGNNEVDAAWLDEGFTTFQTRRYKENKYKNGRDFSLSSYKEYQKKYWTYSPLLDVDQWTGIQSMANPLDEPVSRSSYEYKSSSAYRRNVYTKASLLLEELNYTMGDSLFSIGMKQYYDKWKLKHVNNFRFQQTMESVYGQNLDWFFKPWLYDSQLLDFKLDKWQKNKNNDGTWSVNIEFSHRGSRILPLKILTILKDGSKIRLNQEKFSFKSNGNLSFTVPAEPVSSMIDPDNRTMDVDFRNNFSRRMPWEKSFRWPGMKYKPRKSYVLLWSPYGYYNDVDGAITGIRLTRHYGIWENIDFAIDYSVKSKNLDWHVQGWRKPVHFPRSTKINYFAFSMGGLDGIGLAYTYSWSRYFQRRPQYKYIGGFYSYENHNSVRTDLFDNGLSTVIYNRLNIINDKYTGMIELDVSPEGWSDWSFIRVIGEVKTKGQWKGIEIQSRSFSGFMWSKSSQIPGQERFTVSGAGSYDLIRTHYLRNPSAFFGMKNLRNRYHLKGDGNLRAFWNSDLAGTEKILSNTMEIHRLLKMKKTKLRLIGFIDSGILWGTRYLQGDKGFNGDILADTGIGFRWNRSIWSYPLLLQIDLPFWTYRGDLNTSNISTHDWVFSFQTSI